MTLRALYVDFNSYFATVEQQLRPELRGKVLGVLPVLAETTSCIAASIEAKRFGIKTGTSVRDARKLCRDVIFVEARPAVYIEMHHKLVAAVESCLHVEQVRSIDEMWCRLSGRDMLRENAIWLAQQIKHAVYKAGGLEMRCSIGIGPNRFLAKTASNMQKPNGLVVLELADLPQRLFALELRDLNGIGRAMETRLQACGITTVEQLCAASSKQLRHAWRGLPGERFHALLHGADLPEVETRRGSLGHSHVLAPPLRNTDGAYAVLHRLLQKAGMRLRQEACIAARLDVWIKLQDRQHQSLAWCQQQALDPTSDTRNLLMALDRAWQAYPSHASADGWEPLKVGVNLLDLSEARNENRSLFNDDDTGHELNAAIDALNLRYGKNALYFGGASGALQSAPMRIAFGYVPDLERDSDA